MPIHGSSPFKCAPEGLHRPLTHSHSATHGVDWLSLGLSHYMSFSMAAKNIRHQQPTQTAGSGSHTFAHRERTLMRIAG